MKGDLEPSEVLYVKNVVTIKVYVCLSLHQLWLLNRLQLSDFFVYLEIIVQLRWFFFLH